MRSAGSAVEMERRRRLAVARISEGWPQTKVAAFLGVNPRTARRWWARHRADPDRGLATQPHGRPARLSEQDCQVLEALLLEGAEAHGWRNNLWTGFRVSKLISDRFGVTYNPRYVCAFLQKRLNWSSQRPQRQHPDGNDAATASWIEEEYPRILREAARRNAHLAFVDETGFMLNPVVRRTFAPRGKTPVNRVADPHARISVVGAIVVDPRRKRLDLVYNMLGDNANFRGPGIAYFVRTLRSGIGGPLTILWDRITIHSCEEVERCLKGMSDVVAEAFPPYAPKLNPADGIWGYVKYGRLPNHVPPDLDTLRSTVTAELDRLRRREELLRSFIRHTGLPLVV